jgi:hypothetical protein
MSVLEAHNLFELEPAQQGDATVGAIAPRRGLSQVCDQGDRSQDTSDPFARDLRARRVIPEPSSARPRTQQTRVRGGRLRPNGWCLAIIFGVAVALVVVPAFSGVSRDLRPHRHAITPDRRSARTPGAIALHQSGPRGFGRAMRTVRHRRRVPHTRAAPRDRIPAPRSDASPAFSSTPSPGPTAAPAVAPSSPAPEFF